MASPKYWVKGFWKCRGDSGFTVYVSVIGTDCLPCQRHGRPLGSPPHCLYPSSFWPSWSGTLGSQWSHCLEVQRGGCYLEPYRRGNSPPRSQVSRVGEHTLRSSPSASTSLIMSCSSASVGFCPSDLITVPSSLVVMVPSPSLSKREKASLNSGEGKKCASSQCYSSHLFLGGGGRHRGQPLLQCTPAFFHSFFLSPSSQVIWPDSFPLIVLHFFVVPGLASLSNDALDQSDGAAKRQDNSPSEVH